MAAVIQNMKYLPFRSFNEFLLDSKQYAMPAVNDLKKFNNRIVSNLLYFQTNYIVVSIISHLLFILFGLKKIIFGSVAAAPAIILVLHHFGKTNILAQYQRHYPNVVLITGVVEAIVLYLAFNNVLYFLLTVSVPLGFSIAHAAVRKRGLKNKSQNGMNSGGLPVYDKTPMETLLKTIGVNPSEYNDKE